MEHRVDFDAPRIDLPFDAGAQKKHPDGQEGSHLQCLEAQSDRPRLSGSV